MDYWGRERTCKYDGYAKRAERRQKDLRDYVILKLRMRRVALKGGRLAVVVTANCLWSREANMKGTRII